MKIQQFLYLLLLTSLFYGCGQQDGEFIDLNNDKLPFNKTTFSSAVKKAIDRIKL